MADLKVGTTVGGSPVWHQGNLALVPSGNAILYKGARIYSENDKPTANELQVVSRAGDTMTGMLNIESSTDYPLALKSSVSGPVYMRFSKGNTLQSYLGTDSTGDFRISMTDTNGSWSFDGLKIAKSNGDVSLKGALVSTNTGNFDIKYGSIQFIRANSSKNLYIGAPGGTDLVLGYAQDGMTTTKIRFDSAVYNKTGGLLISDTGLIQRSAMDNPYYNQTESDARFIRLNVNTATTGYLLSKSSDVGSTDNMSMGYSGFFRHNSLSGFRGLTINVSHPEFSNGANARGITFDYGSSGYGLYTYAYNAAGTRLANQKIYTEADKPTPAELGALAVGANAVSASKLQTARTISLTGGATGSVSFDGSANVSLAVTVTNDSHTHSDYVKKIGDTMSGNLTVPKVLLSAAQGAEANSAARRDFVESTVSASGKGVKDLQITLPAGAPTSGYIPVLFETNGTANSFVFIDTLSGSSTLPMNNCSFIGDVRASGWGDGGSYAAGMFTIYSSAERAIHSIHAPTESVNGYVVYIETRAFPISVRVDIGTTVTAYATDATYGTSVFKVNGQVSGNTKTTILADFDKGTGTYNGSQRVYNTGYNPTPEAVGALPVNGNAATASRLQTARLIAGVPFDGTSNISISATNVGALPITGGTLTGRLVVSQSGSSSIAIDSSTGYDGQLQFTRNSTLRFLFNVDAVAESGSNVGSDLNLYAYNDNGTYAGSIFKVRRSTRQLEFQTQPLSIAAQSTSQYALTRRDFVEAQDALNVSKSGDTMTDNLVFNSPGKGILLSSNTPIGDGNGLFVGTGDGASDVKTNVQIKSWFGVGIAPSGTNPDNINNIWFNARNGDISTIGGLTTFGKTGAAFTIKVPSAQSNFILGQTGSDSTWTNSWFVGRGGASEDVSLYSYTHGTNITLASDRINVNKNIVTSVAQSTLANALTRKDYVDAAIDTKASNRVNFATNVGVSRSITGATVPTHAGVWAVNNSTWTPVGYGSLLVTTNRSDELTTTGTGSFIHYLFISHNAAKVYSATNVNGSWSGWKEQIDTSGGQTINGLITATDVLITSDRRLKSKLEVIDNALDKVNSLVGFTYDKEGKDSREAGLIAQEVQAVLPEAIGTTSDEKYGDVLTISHSSVQALVVNAINELLHIVKSQGNEIKQLKDKIMEVGE